MIFKIGFKMAVPLSLAMSSENVNSLANVTAFLDFANQASVIELEGEYYLCIGR